jgi:ankyrin repeat protein
VVVRYCESINIRRCKNILQVDNDRYTSIYMACYKGHLEVVKFLILEGVNIHQTNDGF